MSDPRDIEVTFSAAGERAVEISGRSIRVLEASGDVYFGLNNDSPGMKRTVGQQINLGETGRRFTRFTVASLVAQTVRVTVADVPQDDDHQDVNVAVTSTLTPGNQLPATPEVVVPAGATASLVAANAATLYVVLSVPEDQPNGIYWGPSGLTVSQGAWLGPGMTVIVPTESEITARNRGADPVTVSVQPIRRV